MKIAYLVNQYPKVSHSFIRREILALERQGIEVMRYALRGWDAEVVDPEDIRELQRTSFVLRSGTLALLAAAARLAFVRPLALVSGLHAALRLSRWPTIW
jgi:colanic acid/amylovoran biosynthesis glycosyltransferase